MDANDTQPIPEWLAGEYPFAPRAFQTPAGALLSYLDEGPRNDEAVLMLHGNPTWSFYYRHLVRALAPVAAGVDSASAPAGGIRCIVPDHIGMGASAKPANYDYTLSSRIADVAALVASLALKRVHLVVHDWGGAIGFGFALRHPELIGRIVILNTAAFTSPRIPFRIQVCKLPVVGPLLVRGANGFAWPATWMTMHRRALSPVEKRGYLWPYGTWASRVAVSAFVQDIPLRTSHPSWPVLQQIEQGLALFRNRSVLMIWGGCDFCFNDHFLGRWRAILPEAQVQRIPDAGHYVLEDAREEVVPRIAGFLTQSDTG